MEIHVGVMVSLCEARNILLEWPRDRRKFAPAARLLDLSDAAAVHVIGEPDAGLRLGTEFMPAQSEDGHERKPKRIPRSNAP